MRPPPPLKTGEIAEAAESLHKTRHINNSDTGSMIRINHIHDLGEKIKYLSDPPENFVL